MFKTIKSDFQELIRWIKNYLFHKRHSIRLKLAIRLADMKQKAWNKQYFVILSQTDKLISINNNEVEKLKRMPRYTKGQLKNIEQAFRKREEESEAEMKNKGFSSDEIRHNLYDMKLIRERTMIRLKRMKLLPKELDGLKLRRTSFYYTPLSRNNDPGMSPEDRKEAKIRYLNYARKYLMK